MIIRSLLLRHGRRALPKPPTPSPVRTCRRSLTTAGASDVEATYQNPHADQHYIESAAGGTKSQAVHSLESRSSPPTIALEDDQIARDWHFFHHQKKHTEHIGSAVQKHYRPHEQVSNPPWPRDITLELLMASQAHIGHSTSLWNPSNAKYIFGVRGEHDPIHIISLDVTAAHLRRACKVVKGVTERGGLILFVGSREGQARIVVRAAELAQGCHLFSKWIPGSITNGQQILGKCRKKVVNEYDQEVTGFDDQLVQKAALKPDLVVCLNPLENYVLLHECGLNNIPTIGIVDTDANPTWVTYPIPANDDSLRSVQLIAGVLGRAGQEGQSARLEKAKRRIVDYRQDHGLSPPSKESEETRTKREKEQSLLAGADAFDVSEAAVYADADADEPERTDVTAEQVVNMERLAQMGSVDPGLLSEQLGLAAEQADVPYEVDAPLGQQRQQRQDEGAAKQVNPFQRPTEDAEQTSAWQGKGAESGRKE